MSEVVTPRSTKLFNYRKKGCHELWKAGIPLKIIREQPVWVSLVQGAVHHEDRDALPLGHGLKMLQLEGTVEGWSSSTPNRDDEWMKYQQLLDDKLEVFMHLHGTTHFAACGPLPLSKIVTKWFNNRSNISLIE
jgi:hypothetical protein